jgi:hypothetical protein
MLNRTINGTLTHNGWVYVKYLTINFNNIETL